MSCLLFVFSFASSAFAAEESPYELDPESSLSGFTRPQGVAIDSFGDEYVASIGAPSSPDGLNGRIKVFSPEGDLITQISYPFGPKSVAVDGSGNLYVFGQLAGGSGEYARYSPSLYKPEEGKIEYSNPRVVIDTKAFQAVAGIAINASNNHVYLDENNQIREYGPAESGNEFLGAVTNEKLKSSVYVAVDAQRHRLYASTCPEEFSKCWILVFSADAPHELLEEVKGEDTPAGHFASGQGWMSVAVDEKTGSFFVWDVAELPFPIYRFDEDYQLVSTTKTKRLIGGNPLQIAISNAKGSSNFRYLFAPAIEKEVLAFHPPSPEGPPEVDSLSTTISETEIEMKALIKPTFADTTYTFQLTTQQAFEEDGGNWTDVPALKEGVIPSTDLEENVSAVANELVPATGYRFRVFTENTKGKDEKEASFTTYDDDTVTNACETQPLRLAFSALLPDCRAYELVTPPDTNGRVPRGVGFVGDQFLTREASPQGNVVSFLTEGGVIPGLGGAGGLNGDLYRATRGSSGWTTISAGPDGSESISPNIGSTSSDQSYAFWVATREGSAVIEGKATHYVRYPDGHSALVGRGSLGTEPEALGRLITEGGGHIIFQTRKLNASLAVQLEPNAPPTGTSTVYDRTADEVTHVVSLLPGNETPKAGENATYVGASPDGQGIAFNIGNELYLRVGNTFSYEIGEGVTFAGVSEDGSRIFYVEGGDLFAFDTITEEDVQFTETGNAVPVNVSADGTRAYFASITAISGSGENPNGEVAQEGKGKENLYLSDAGIIHFVGTVTERDVVGEKNKNNAQVDGLGLWTSAIGNGELARDPSRTNPAGTVLLFSSRANLDGYAHEGVSEIYRYDSAGDRLHCISCIPTKTAATGGASLESVAPSQSGLKPFSASGFVENLRADGNRAIFESTEALVSRDNDGVQDIYEWEELGEGSCTRSGGCVYLISSGKSATDDYLYAISASGGDIFFTSNDILVGGDNSTLSIYDARINGGFEEIPCQKAGECIPDKPLPPTPLFPAPESEGVPGPPAVPSKPCSSDKHKATRNGKQVCVKNKKHHKKHHAKSKGRAGK